MTKIHYIVAAKERYAEWCCLSVYSLITRGKVNKEDILVSMQGSLGGSEAAFVLATLGITVEFHDDAYWSKFLFIDKALRRRGVSRVIQIDCDCVLTEDIDFVGVLSSLRGKHALSYVSKADPIDTIARRGKLFLPGFDPNTSMGRSRMDSFLESSFGFNFKSLEESCIGWVYGGVIVVDKSILQLPVWKSLMAFSWVCRCDELTLMLAINSKSGFRWGSIPQEVLAHRVNPKVLNLESGEGLVHFAGDWYRVDNETNKELLRSSFLSLLERCWPHTPHTSS